MAIRVEIKCIVKTNRSDAHQRIQSVGGVNPDGQRWKLSEADAIKGIHDDKWDFWTQGGGKTVDVVIAKREGKEYLKTKNDGVQPDNLLALPTCP